MATQAGIPLPCLQAGALNQFDWLNPFGDETQGITHTGAMQGQPSPMSWWQRRQIPQRPTYPQPMHTLRQGMVFDRGADAFAPQFGKLHFNVIGAGIPSTYKLPPIAGPGATYMAAAIWFGVQAIPTSVRMNPTVPIETINALLAQSRATAAYQTTG
jgi:hypothetical protein